MDIIPKLRMAIALRFCEAIVIDFGLWVVMWRIA